MFQPERLFLLLWFDGAIDVPVGTLNEFCTEFYILHTIQHCFRNVNGIMLR